MTKFNLSEWALNNQSLLRYFIVLLALAGIWSYTGLGQSEDPPFTFKVMVVQTQWPGATAAEITQQVTEKIEKKLQELPQVDFLRSYSRPAESPVLGVSFQQLQQTLSAQNAITPAGSFETGTDRIYLRPTGAFDSVEAVRDISIRANGHLFRLGDIADVTRGYADPPNPRMRFMGKNSLGIAVSMRAGGDII